MISIRKFKWLLPSVFSVVILGCTDRVFINQDTTVFEPGPEIANLSRNVTDRWNDLWLDVDRYCSGMRPNATARALAYIHLAAYETAAPYMEDHTSATTFIDDLDIDFDLEDEEVDLNLALNACYARVVAHYMTNIENEAVEAAIPVLENELAALFGQFKEESLVERSEAWGEYVAETIIAFGQTDTEAEGQILEPQPTSYEPEVGEGFWTYSAEEERALFPYWESVRTFAAGIDDTSTVPPLEYSENESSEYFRQMQEVYDVSVRAREEDNEDLWIAEFWSDDVVGMMMSPPGRQLSIANQLIEQENLGPEDTLALLLRLGIALNDAAVNTWHDKYEYMVMRPNVFIHEFIDPDFQTNLYRLVFWPNPTFPGYPSGHATFASASAGVLINTFGDRTQFTDRSHQGRTEFRGMPRTFNLISVMAKENAESRLPLGVHVRMDCDEGIRLGFEIADFVNDLPLER